MADSISREAFDPLIQVEKVLIYYFSENFCQGTGNSVTCTLHKQGYIKE